MNLLKKIFTDEGTALTGLCQFKSVKVHVGCETQIKFSDNKNFCFTDFSKNVLLY